MIAVEKCVTSLVEIWKWMLSQGVVSRGVLIPLIFYISSIFNRLPKDYSRRITRTMIGLCRVAVPDVERNDYELALIGEQLIRLLVIAGNRFNNSELLEYARDIYKISIDSWRKYGFEEKAKEIEEKLASTLR